MARFEILHNPRCSKSRQTLERLRAAGVEPTVVEYLREPPSRERLAEIVRLLGLPDARGLVRTGEAVYAELGLATASPEAVLDAMAAHPLLIERPVVIKDGRRAVIGRPPENVDALLSRALREGAPPMPHPYVAFDPLLSPAEAATMVDICERYGSYKMYSEEPTFEGLGAGLPARWDAARNFVKTGGRFGRSEPMHVLAARTNYFRETYAYGDEVRAPGVEPFLHHEGFVEGARKLFGRPVIVPAIVYANLLVPGQELAVHTDVPEFRGVSRLRHPQWLIVAMHHSRLFEEWRMPIATGVAWFHDCAGGEFAFYPNGPDGPPVSHPVRYNTALMMDTDSVFHGVDRVAETAAPVEGLRPGMRLRAAGDGAWEVVDEAGTAFARYRWEELRYSVSWKAYCFADEAERRAWASHADDLSVEMVVDRLVEGLRERGVLTGPRPGDVELVDLLIDGYIHYPAPAPAAAAS